MFIALITVRKTLGKARAELEPHLPPPELVLLTQVEFYEFPGDDRALRAVTSALVLCLLRSSVWLTLTFALVSALPGDLSGDTASVFQL